MFDRTMHRYFDEHYDLLKERLAAMAGCVREVIADTIVALSTGDVALAQETIRADEQIDLFENELDELVMKLLALQQPMAIDLRFIITALKINNDLERMGDQAVNIAQTVTRLAETNGNRAIVDFAHMEDIVQQMVHGCIEAFATGDVDLARRVLLQDDEVDEMNRAFIRKLARHASEHPDDADSCISLLLVSRNLERIGDLSTNIAEDVVYYIEGKIIKHAPREPEPESNT